MGLDIADIVQQGRLRVVNVDGDQLPIGFPLIQEGQRPQDFDLNHSPTFVDLRTDFDHINRVVVPVRSRVRVFVRRVLPSLGQSAVVPNVAVVREDVVHKARFSVLYVLLDWGQWFFGSHLKCESSRLAPPTHLHFCVCPSRDLDNHVKNLLLFVRIQRDIVPR